jgi:hypothetical protein
MTTTFAAALSAGKTTMSEALAIFDALEPVDIPFMLGSWKGDEFPTGHRLDGMLAAYHWHGKRFESADQVHPLVFENVKGNLKSVHPLMVMPGVPFAGRVPFLKTALVGKAFQLLIPFIKAKSARATLKLVPFRGKTSAAMVYKDLPITDSFRKVDADTVLGCMDMKGMKEPYFFVLRREK